MRNLGKLLLAFPLVHKLQEEVVLVEVLGVNPGDAGKGTLAPHMKCL